jgi:hypothetical protein
MKRFLPLIGVLALVVIVSGCVDNLPDCNGDIDCFTAALENCEGAKVTMEEEGAKMFMKHWPAGANCNLYIKIEEAFLKEMEGLDMTCTYPKDMMFDPLVEYGSLEDFCSGSFVDYMKSGFGMLGTPSNDFGA